MLKSFWRDALWEGLKAQNEGQFEGALARHLEAHGENTKEHQNGAKDVPLDSGTLGNPKSFQFQP